MTLNEKKDRIQTTTDGADESSDSSSDEDSSSDDDDKDDNNDINQEEFLNALKELEGKDLSMLREMIS